jgi:molecular chaperone DnaK
LQVTGQERRDQRRVYVGLLVRVKSRNVDEFVEYYATNISTGGIFIQSRNVYPEGTFLKFEVQLKTGKPVLRGRGVVAWTREPTVAGGKPRVPGMGVRFVALAPGSEDLVRKIVQLRSQVATPTSSAQASSVQAQNKLKSMKKPDLSPEESSIDSPEEISIDVDFDDEDALEIDIDLEDLQKTSPLSGFSSKVIGIDLGTTNSCASVVLDGKPRIIPSQKGHRTIPSIVAYDEKNRLLVGQAAKNQMELNPQNTIYGSKRLIGRPFSSPAVRYMSDRFMYKIIEGPGHTAAVMLLGKPFSLQQVAAFILSDIREIAREMLGEEVDRAVVTVPAYYNENQRQAVREAGVLAGLRIERMINEPTAAALAFGFNRRLDQRILVYDLGGGTFDVSVLELTDNVYEVVATGGDLFLGGVDFDNQLVDYLLESFIKDVGSVPSLDGSAVQRLRATAESAKCALSEKRETIVRLPFFATINKTPKDLEVRVSREKLEELVRPLVDRTMGVSLQVLGKAGWHPEQLDNILLVGGQSRMPLIWQIIEKRLGQVPSKGVHADEAVAIGAALVADSTNRIDAMVLIDVLPMNIGLGVPGGAFVPVLQAGTSLPASKRYTLSTFREGQREFELLIFQGESGRAIDNEYLGTLDISGIPPKPKGAVRIDITFSLDQECLLKVSARDLSDSRKLKAKMVAKDTDESIRMKLKIHH